MNSINFDFLNIGQRLSNFYTKHLQEGTLQRLAALVNGLTGNESQIVIIHGCEQTVSGATYNITSGVIYYQGDFYDVSATTLEPNGNQLQYVLEETPTGQALYGDNQLRDTFFDTRVTIQFGAIESVIGDFIADNTLKGKIESLIGLEEIKDSIIKLSDDFQQKLDTAIDDLIGGAPGTLDTLNELAEALNDDDNFASTVTASLANKLSLSGGTMGGEINMGQHRITQLPAATGDFGAVNKKQLDEVSSDLNDALLKRPLLNTVYDITPWNMTTSNLKIIPVSIDISKIELVSIKIRNDSNNITYLNHHHIYSYLSGTSIVLVTDILNNDYQFKNPTQYVSTSFNRGTITVFYTE